MTKRMNGSTFGSGWPKSTASILGFGSSRIRAAKKPTVVNYGRAEREQIARTLVKSPNYLPGDTKKSLKFFARQVAKNKDDFTKAEQVFARDTLDADHVIKDENEKMRFVRGEAEALVATKDRGIHDPYRILHHGNEVAREIVRGVQASATKKDAVTVSERRAQVGGAHQVIPTTSQPTTPTTPATSWRATPEKGVAHTLPSQAPHAGQVHHLSMLGSISAGALRFGSHLPANTHSDEREMVAPSSEPETLPTTNPAPKADISTPPPASTIEIPSASSAVDLPID